MEYEYFEQVILQYIVKKVKENPYGGEIYITSRESLVRLLKGKRNRYKLSEALQELKGEGLLELTYRDKNDKNPYITFYIQKCKEYSRKN